MTVQHDMQKPTSAVHSLPIEIISKIFLEGTREWRELRPKGFPFPTLISGVCSNWRNLSEKTRELWTFILPPLHKEIDDCVDWTSKWLSRSGTALVSVVLDDMTVTTEVKGKVASSTERKIAKTLVLLAEHTHRLRRLDIRSARQGAFKKFVRDLWKAPHLEQLSLCSRQYVSLGFLFLPEEEDSKWSALQRLPNLRKFRFQNISPPCISSLTSMTAHRLTLNYECAKTLFTGCPSLTHLVLHDLPIFGALQENLQRQPITVPSLHSLAVEISPWWLHEPDASYLFSVLKLPNLVSLELRGDIPKIVNLFGSALSSANIKKLRLSNMSYLLSDGVHFFKSLSGLEELEMLQVPAWDLASDDDQGTNFTWWPHLQTIYLDTSQLKTLLPWLDFVEWRSSVSHLRISNFYLSKTSTQLLAEGDEASEDHHRFLTKFEGGSGEQWLKRFVEVNSLRWPSYGLLDEDRPPLEEMA